MVMTKACRPTDRAASQATYSGDSHVAFFSPPQILPLYRRRHRADRLQRSRDAEGIHHGNGQDRTEPHYRHEVELSTSVGRRGETRPLPGIVALHGSTL